METDSGMWKVVLTFISFLALSGIEVFTWLVELHPAIDYVGILIQRFLRWMTPVVAFVYILLLNYIWTH